MSLRIAAFTAAIVGALLLVGGAGAGGQPPKKVDVTNPTAVNAYLSSIGIDPATVVKQAGLNNYAGPNCPGVGWTCTTSTRVVQASTAGGQNKFECEGQQPPNPATNPDTNTCVVVQGGPNNKAECQLKDTGTPTESQSCVIQQDGDRNLAIVDELITQKGNAEEDATQTADVEQNATDKNESQVHQDVKQDSNVVSSGAQNQNVHQVAIVHQQASGSRNFSHVHQNQDLDATGPATLQQQNVAGLPTGISDCDFEHKAFSNPNACANVVQIIGTFVGGQLTGPGGTNESHLHQNINEHAHTSTSAASVQNQEKADTGIEGVVDQENPPNVGTNLKIAHQDGRQRAEGGASQNQIIDPNCCGVGTTIGGAHNLDQFHQTAIQSATLGTAAFQELGITGDTDHIANAPGDAPSLGASPSNGGGVSNVCIIHHDARDNTDSTAFTFKIDPCDVPVTIETRCVSASASEGPPGCTHTSPPTECPCITTPLQSSPTFGNPIAPPDFGEPSDFPGPIFPGI